MDIRLATSLESKRWDAFVIANSPSSFLQSWAWGEVLAADGRLIRRLMAYAGKRLTGVGLISVFPAPFGFSYGYCPHGPIAKDEPTARGLLKAAAREFKSRRLLFIRTDPERGPIYIGRPAPKGPAGSAVFAPPALAMLDISPSEDKILAAMKQKTRYNLRRSRKLGVRVTAGAAQKEFETFWQLLRATQARAGFGLHLKSHYAAIRQAFGRDALIVTASHEDRPLAVLLLVFFGQRAAYVHGGSLREHQTMMAPYAAHWFAIQEAKRRGCLAYDFGGASKDEAGGWAGFTRFKLGFGARIIHTNSRRDFVLRPLARRAFYALRAIRSKLKRP